MLDPDQAACLIPRSGGEVASGLLRSNAVSAHRLPRRCHFAERSPLKESGQRALGATPARCVPRDVPGSAPGGPRVATSRIRHVKAPVHIRASFWQRHDERRRHGLRSLLRSTRGSNMGSRRCCRSRVRGQPAVRGRSRASRKDHCPSPKYLPRHRMLANHGTRRVPATPCGPLIGCNIMVFRGIRGRTVDRQASTSVA